MAGADRVTPIDRAKPNLPDILRPGVAGAPVRSSQNVTTGAGAAAALAGVPGMYAPLAYMLPFQVLDYIEMVAEFNPDYSQAVENIKTLANSGFNIFVTGATRTSSATKKRLDSKALTIQKSFGGLQGMIDQLLQQAATYGAMCGEWLVNEEMDDVIDFADINPKLIRFFWEDNHWAPYQKVAYFQMQEALKAGQRTRQGNYVKLNELTFHYYAFNSAPMSPYGTPPFLAALPHITTQQDMLFNMAQVVKKVGMLGVIDIAVQQLSMLPGESTDQFKNRATSYLEEYAAAMEEMMNSGGFAHFDDAELKATGLSGNAAGATAIFKQNEELLFSGLKSMPSVQGRSYSTTETYAGVAYDIIIRNTLKFQNAVKAMVESGFWLMAALWSENPDTITLEFEPNKTLHRLEEAKAENMEIINTVMLWVMGILDQQSVSHRLGFNDPARQIEEAPSGDPIFGHPTNTTSADQAGQEGGDNPPSAGAAPKSAEIDDEHFRAICDQVMDEFQLAHPELFHPELSRS